MVKALFYCLWALPAQKLLPSFFTGRAVRTRNFSIALQNVLKQMLPSLTQKKKRGFYKPRFISFI